MRTDSPPRPASTPAEAGGSAENPFPGPKSYTSDQARWFFGRSELIAQLRSLVMSRYIVLLHAPSGAGKTSLIQAGLLPTLPPADVTILPRVEFAQFKGPDSAGDHPPAPTTERVLDASTAARRPANPYVEFVLNRAVPDRSADAGFDRRTLIDPDVDLTVLVLDEFESFFADPYLSSARKDFLDRLVDLVDPGRAASAGGQLRHDEAGRLMVLIGMRSDHVADLVPYQNQLPSSLVVRLGIQSLNERQAGQVLDQTFAHSTPGLPDELRARILDSLFAIRLPGADPTLRAEFCNLIQLQIICRRIWRELSADDAPTTDTEFLDSPSVPATGTSSAGMSSDGIMVDFVDDVVRSVSSSARVDKKIIRLWLANLITGSRTRDFLRVEDAVAATEGSVVNQLKDERLILVEERNGARRAELTHDSMVPAVLSSNERWRRRYRRRQLRSIFASSLVVATMATAFLIWIRVPQLTNILINSTSSRGSTTFQFTSDAAHPLIHLTLSKSAWESSSSELELLVRIEQLTGDGSSRVLSQSYTLGRKLDILVALSDPAAPHQVSIHSLAGAAVSDPFDLISNDPYYALSVDALPAAVEVSKLDTEPEVDYSPISSGTEALALPPDRYFVVESLDTSPSRSGTITAQDVLWDYDTTTLLSTRTSPIVLLSDQSGKVRVRGIAPPEELQAGHTTTITATDQPQYVTVTATWRDLPEVVDIACGDPTTDLSARTSSPSDVYSWNVTASGPDIGLTTRYSIDRPGDYTFRIVRGDADTSCNADLRIPNPAISTFGELQLSAPPATYDSSATRIFLPGDGVLTATLPDGIYADVNCESGVAWLGRADSRRVLAFIPAETYCVVRVLGHTVDATTASPGTELPPVDEPSIAALLQQFPTVSGVR